MRLFLSRSIYLQEFMSFVNMKQVFLQIISLLVIIGYRDLIAKTPSNGLVQESEFHRSHPDTLRYSLTHSLSNSVFLSLLPIGSLEFHSPSPKEEPNRVLRTKCTQVFRRNLWINSRIDGIFNRFLSMRLFRKI